MNRNLRRMKTSVTQSAVWMKSKYTPFIIIFMVGAAIYSHTLNYSFHFDDVQDIVHNEAIRDITDVHAWSNYALSRPVAMFSLALNYYIHKYDPVGFHLFNIFIHICCAFVVFWLTRMTLSSPAMNTHPMQRHKEGLALFAGLMFVVHPIQTQAVTYIVQRMASMATLFYLLSLALYAKGRLWQGKSVAKYLLFGGSILSALLGMFTKQIVFTLPFAIILYECTFFKTQKWRINYRNKRFILGSLLFIAFTAIIPVVWSFDFSLLFREIPPQQGHTYWLKGFDYLFTQFRVIVTYIRLLFVPINQNIDYDFPISHSILEPATLLSLLFLLAIFSIGIYFFKRQRFLSFGIFWFFLTLSVESSFIPLPNVIFEHRLYLPGFGFILFFINVLYSYVWRGNTKGLSYFLAAYLLALSLLTVQRNKVWKDELTLWTDSVKKSPRLARPHYNLGVAYMDLKEYGCAIAEYEQAIQINPFLFETWNNLGIIYLIQEQYDKAMTCFNQTLEIKPGYVKALNNRGLVYIEYQEYELALADFEKAIRLEPACNLAYKGRGDVNQHLGKYNEAISDYTIAIQYDSLHSQTYFQRGMTYLALKDYPSAIRDFNKTTSLAPHYEKAFYNRGLCWHHLNDHNRAIDDFTKAIEIDSNYAKALYNRSLTYAYHQKKYKQAWLDLLQAKKLGYDVDNSYYLSLAKYFMGKN